MIHIYNSNNINYSNNGDMILNPSEAYLVLELNGLNAIEVTQPYDSLRRFESIEGDKVVKIDAPNNQTMFYRICETNRDLETEVYFNALPLAIIDLQKSAIIDCRPTNATGQDFLNKVLEGTKFKGTSDITKTNTSHLIRKSRYDALFNDENSFLSRYGGEIWLEGFNIHIKDKLGLDNNVTFEYGKDILDLNEKLLFSSVVTRIYPIGYDGITLPETGYIDSPNINKYQEIKEAFIKFEDVKVKSNEDEEGFATLEEAQEELRHRALKAFENGIDLPQLEMTIEVAKLEEYLEYKDFKELLKVNLGDTVRVRHSLLDIDITTRVVAIKYDLVNEKYTEITLSSQVSDYIKNQSDTNNRVESALNSDGSVKASEVKGFIDGAKAGLKASKEIAQLQDYRVMQTEDLDPASPTFGSLLYGSTGLYLASQRNAQNTDWDYTTAITGKGIIADRLVGSLYSKDGNFVLNLDEGFMKNYFNGKARSFMNNGALGWYSGVAGNESVVGMLSQTYVKNSNNKEDWGVSQIIAPNQQYSIIRSSTPLTDEGKFNYQDYQVIFDRDGDAFYQAKNCWFEVGYFPNGDTWRDLNIGVADNGSKGLFSINSNGGTTLVGGGSSLWLTNDKGGCFIYCGNDSIQHNFNTRIDGNLEVINGSKNCVQSTKNYGDRLFYSVEDGGSWLTYTETKVQTTANKEIRIEFEPMFKESVNLDIDYIIDVHKVGFGDHRIKEQTKDYFILESDRDIFEFKYTIKAKRLGYEDCYMELSSSQSQSNPNVSTFAMFNEENENIEKYETVVDRNGTIKTKDPKGSVWRNTK